MRIPLIMALFFAWPHVAAAQTAPASPVPQCMSAEHRQFDKTFPAQDIISSVALKPPGR